jgi:hypothetical protein
MPSVWLLLAALPPGSVNLPQAAPGPAPAAVEAPQIPEIVTDPVLPVQDYMATTLGCWYRMRKGLIFRNEIRYDFNPDSTPFEGKHSILTAAADFIIRW